jgi:hypothetical protein
MIPPPHSSSSRHDWQKIGGIATVIAVAVASIAIIVAHHDAQGPTVPIVTAAPISIPPPTSATPTEASPTPIIAPTKSPADPRATASEIGGNTHTPGGGPLTLHLDLPGGKIGVDTYKSPMRLGWISRVYDDAGEVAKGCYIQWSLYKGEERVFTYSSICDNNPLTGTKLGAGTYKFVANISTDSGRTGTGSKIFYVVD